MRPPAYPGVLILFPITSRSPGSGRIFDAVPAGECRTARLEMPAWIMLDEYNVALESAPYDFASLDAQGEFSTGYQRRLAGIVAKLLEEKKVSKVMRR